ncbi:DUF6221 family protein [Streptomyces sp. NPDC051132]|uniref:DUF6221 family protein n=1 Tax=unclassified Streptomyces TaxID=2593676 RepID=UPI003449EFC1
MTDELVRWLGEQLDTDARIARAAMQGNDSGTWHLAPTLPMSSYNATRDGATVLCCPPSSSDPGEELAWLTVSTPPRAPEGEQARAVGRHVEAHDPARVLREITADRGLLQQYERLLHAHARHKVAAAELAADIEHQERTGRWEGVGSPGTRVAALRREADYLTAMLTVLEGWVRAKAAVYADRPGYREEWRS